MKNICSMLLIAFSLIVFNGCKRSLSLEDIVRAQGISWWDIDLAPIGGQNATFGITYRNMDGTLVQSRTMDLFSASDIEKSKTLRVLVWDKGEPMLKFAVLWDDDKGVMSSITNKFDPCSGITYPNVGDVVQLGDPLITGWATSTNESDEQVQLIIQTNIYQSKGSESQPKSTGNF